MTHSTEKRSIAIVTACMTLEGLPTFTFNQVEASQDEIDNGIHFYLAEADLLLAGYDGPFIHFDEDEAPEFLHGAVRQYLGLGGADYVSRVLTEDC